MMGAPDRPGQSTGQNHVETVELVFKKRKGRKKKGALFGTANRPTEPTSQAESKCPNSPAKFPPSLVHIAYQGRFGRLVVVGLPAKTPGLSMPVKWGL